MMDINFLAAISSVILITAALLLETKNFGSSLVFKVIPFGLGVAHGIVALKGYGVV